jgi:hypothetical protein
VLQGIKVTRFRPFVSAITACLVLCFASFDHASAQTGAAATKQMQDTQRAAHSKARAAKGNKDNQGGATQDQMKTRKPTPPASATDAH